MVATAIETSKSAPALQAAPKSNDDAPEKEAEAEFTFDDLIDIINPLHHIPVVSTIYRALTGDQISVHARAIGGGVYGGPIGILAAGASMAAEEAMGVSGESMLADIFSGDDEKAALAAAQPDSKPNAAAQAANQTPDATAAPPAIALAAQGAKAMPFTAKDGTRMFALPDRGANTMPLQKAAPPAATPAAAPKAASQLSTSQSALLERFVAGAQQSGARATTPGREAQGLQPPEGATAEWFAQRMQANLQKYVAAQQAADRQAALAGR